jgi:hypothetical protein
MAPLVVFAASEGFVPPKEESDQYARGKFTCNSRTLNRVRSQIFSADFEFLLRDVM